VTTAGVPTASEEQDVRLSVTVPVEMLGVPAAHPVSPYSVVAGEVSVVVPGVVNVMLLGVPVEPAVKAQV
jgi:hypothetical protein